MSIHCPIEFRELTNAQYNSLDRIVLHHSYASHNQLGRLYDEDVYETDICERFRELEPNLQIARQVPLMVQHRDFVKRYILDLVVENAALYELKTVRAFTPAHEAQLLNYILLLGLQRGKLLNFHLPKVKGYLLVTNLSQARRREFVVDTQHWKDFTSSCSLLRKTMIELLENWGAYLEIKLYEEALIHFLGGKAKLSCVKCIKRDGIILGSQSVLQHSPQLMFRLTAYTDDLAHHRSHFERFLKHTHFRALQWINLNRHQIQFVTID